MTDERDPEGRRDDGGRPDHLEDLGPGHLDDLGPGHLDDLPDGSGCMEIWEHLSSKRSGETDE